ncbi:MAG TPA: hypothetical protein VMF66_04540, partial [Candidatus Acidoferrum sp.]|nr:hypothetical protein [Candidatus Acidoferrum sp.]
TPIRSTPHQHASSSPQRDEPPDVVIGAMKWLPKPSVRTAFGLGAIAAAVVAYNRRSQQIQNARA